MPWSYLTCSNPKDKNVQAIPLGRVTVAVAGTPVTFASKLTAVQLAKLPPSGLVARIEVWPDPSASGKAYIMCQPSSAEPNAIIAALPQSTGYPIPWMTDGDSGRNLIAYSQYSLDVQTGGDGAYITLWVE